jgi:hypothetical protein
MRPFGFSTGALAKGDVRAGVDMQWALGVTAVELSALRSGELLPLIKAAEDLDLQGLKHISVHAPSELNGVPERELVQLLGRLPSSWPIILHPDVIVDSEQWRFLGSRLCIENMDQRKTVGRTVSELESIFRSLPDAGFCFDIGHARQVDPTMGIAIGLLQRFRERLREVHMSEVDPQGKHIPISFAAFCGFRRVAKLIPESCPVIIESVVQPGGLESELDVARRALSVEPDALLVAMS